MITRAGDKFELAPGETKTRSGSHKVVCPHRPAGQNTFTYVAMKGHVETKHPAHFGAMFGAPVPKSACPECGVYFPSKHLADHLLKAHGSVPLKDRKNTQVLKRMKESVLLDLLATEGRAQNTLKKRIRAGCSRLREHGSARLKDRLMGAYGLDVTKVWPTDASGAGEEIKGLIGAGKGQPKTGGEATRLWLAQQLALLRDEAGQKFRLADGEIGGYREVADEIEDILVRASLAR